MEGQGADTGREVQGGQLALEEERPGSADNGGGTGQQTQKGKCRGSADTKGKVQDVR